MPEHAELAQMEAARQRLDTAATQHTTAQRELATAQRRADQASANHGQARGAQSNCEPTWAATGRRCPALCHPSHRPRRSLSRSRQTPMTIRPGVCSRRCGRRPASYIRPTAPSRNSVGRASCAKAGGRARAAVVAARDELRTTEQAVRQAQAGLRSARERVLALNPPAIDDEDVRAAWTQLSSWATAQERERAEQLPRLQAESDAAAGAADEQRTSLRDAEATVAALQRAATETARVAQRAESELTACQKRRDNLTASLADGMTDAQAVAELDRVAKLEDAVADAEKQLETARTRRDRAAQSWQQAQAGIAAALCQLAMARDPLVQLGAPLHDSDDVATGWTELLGWAAQQATRRQQQLAEALALTEQRAADLRDSEQELSDLLTEHAVPVELGTSSLRDAAQVAVAGALAAARSQQQRMAERVEQVAVMRYREATERSRVARQLADLMRMTGSPAGWRQRPGLAGRRGLRDAGRTVRWAVRADSCGRRLLDYRPQRGGRVPAGEDPFGWRDFQASLALALAISSRMSSLAAEGAARLESIFLDEGFGTLDEASLSMVADTLENLSTSGSRWSVSITHVNGLADRVPFDSPSDETAPAHTSAGRPYEQLATLPSRPEYRSRMRFNVDGWDPGYGPELTWIRSWPSPASDVDPDIEVPQDGGAHRARFGGHRAAGRVVRRRGPADGCPVWIDELIGDDGVGPTSAIVGICASYAAGVVCFAKARHTSSRPRCAAVCSHRPARDRRDTRPERTRQV